MMPNMQVLPHILVFDSGAGGLSVAKEILRKIPNCHMSYAADDAFYPYGIKEDRVLTQRIITQVGKLYEALKPDIVVVACNTASTLALETLRGKFDCPFVGVVPAIKPAALLSESKVIAVLATPATVSRIYTHNLIKDYAPEHKVILHGSNILVEIAERKLFSNDIDQRLLQKEFDTLFAEPDAEQIDTLVLACTHFPLLKQEIMAITRQRKRSINLIDSGEAIARRVWDLLDKPQANEIQNLKKITREIKIILTQTDDLSTAKKSRFLAYLTSKPNTD